MIISRRRGFAQIRQANRESACSTDSTGQAESMIYSDKCDSQDQTDSWKCGYRKKHQSSSCRFQVSKHFGQIMERVTSLDYRVGELQVIFAEVKSAITGKFNQLLKDGLYVKYLNSEALHRIYERVKTTCN